MNWGCCRKDEMLYCVQYNPELDTVASSAVVVVVVVVVGVAITSPCPCFVACSV